MGCIDEPALFQPHHKLCLRLIQSEASQCHSEEKEENSTMFH